MIRIWVAWWLLVCVASAAIADQSPAWDGRPPLPADVSITVRDSHPDGFDWQGLARALIGTVPGDMSAPDDLARVDEALRPFFEKVERTVSEGDRGALHVRLRPRKQIYAIHIQGNYPLFERDVRNAMTIAPGGVFDPEAMPEQENLVAQRFRAEGYVAPRVAISWRQRSTDGHYRLLVAIQKGPHFLLDAIHPHGNRYFEDDQIRRRMASWRRARLTLGTARFKSDQFQADVRNLTARYRRNGFAEVDIAAQTFIDPQTHTVVGALTITEGPRYRIAFAGNTFFPDRRLRREVVLFETGNRGNIGLRRSVNNIRRRYLKAGFADVTVRWQAESSNNAHQTTQVIFDIDEGPRHIVEQVIIHGNRHLDNETLQRQILTRPPRPFRPGVYVADVLAEDLVAIRALYQSHGFLSVRAEEQVVVDPDTAKVIVTIVIDEGPRTRVGAVAVSGDAPVDSDQLRAVLSLGPGDAYLPVKRRDDEDRLAAHIASLGHPHVRAKGSTTVSENQTRADIEYAIDAGPRVAVGEIFFLGTFRTRDGFLRREMGLERRDPFALQRVWESQRDLRDLNIFESVQVRTIGLKERKETVHLLVQAAEQKPYYLEAGGGYQSDKGFYGRTKVGDRNFMGTAKEIRASVEASEVGYRWDAGIIEPRLLGSRIRTDAGVFGERSELFNQPFGTRSRGANINFARGWGRHYTTALALRYEHREQFLRSQSETTVRIDPESLAPRTIVVASPFVQFDSRDSFIRPRFGHLASIGVDISKGLDNALDDFLKYRFDARTFYSPTQRLTLAGRVWLGLLSPYGGDAPPLDQLFFLGGTNSVRGFGENLLRFDSEGKPVGGRMALAASLEARFDIGRNFELVPFLDAGSLWRAPGDAGSDSLRWSTGLGVQYITPIGPIGLFYGHKIDRRAGESRGQLHLSIGYTF